MSRDPENTRGSGPPPATRSRHWENKIIVCCDGTGKGDSPPWSNVYRIFECIEPRSRDGVWQHKHYVSGIGTDNWKLFTLRKRAVGAGVDKKIQEAYKFICFYYESYRTMICLIGYSRGAYVVRCLAQFIQDAGLLRRNSMSHLQEIYSLWEEKEVSQRFRALVNENSRPNIRVHICAVWDTVSSLSFPMPAPISQPAPTRMSFVNSSLCHNIDQSFQAIALHEHRRHFLPIVWRLDGAPLNEDSLEQCWFAGYHSDIGGGRKEECLAHISLLWMMSKLKNFVNFDKERAWYTNPDPSTWQVYSKLKKAHIQDSFSGVHVFGGSKGRRPRCHFWTPRFSETQPPPLPEDRSNEKMHYTVRALLRLSSLRQYKRLNDTSSIGKDVEAGQYVWELRRKTDEEGTEYKLLEDAMDEQERKELNTWVRRDLDLIGHKSEPSDESPRTEIARLLHAVSYNGS